MSIISILPSCFAVQPISLCVSSSTLSHFSSRRPPYYLLTISSTSHLASRRSPYYFFTIPATSHISPTTSLFVYNTCNISRPPHLFALPLSTSLAYFLYLNRPYSLHSPHSPTYHHTSTTIFSPSTTNRARITFKNGPDPNSASSLMVCRRTSTRIGEGWQPH